LKKRLIQYVGQKLSCLQATDRKETAHGDGALPLRQVRLEGRYGWCVTPGVAHTLDLIDKKWPAYAGVPTITQQAAG
jgi:hypothetical protein